MIDDKNIMTNTEACKYLGISRYFMRQLIKKKKIRPLRAGKRGKYRFTRRAVEKLLIG